MHPFEAVKLWNVSAAPILNDPEMSGLLAMVPALACDWQDLRKVAEAVCKSGDDNQLSRFLLMLSLKYDDNQIEACWKAPYGFCGDHLGRFFPVEGYAGKGHARGLAEGKTAGQLTEARRLLRSVLSSRFPGLDSMSEIDRIEDVGSLESLLIDRALRGSDGTGDPRRSSQGLIFG